MKLSKLYFLVFLLFAYVPLLAKEKESESAVDPWSIYVYTSPVADLLQRPNLGIQGVWRRITLALKASWFRDASQVFDYGLDSSEDFGTVSARGFEIGPQFGYLFELSSSVYLMPRLGVYRSIVHYSGGHSSCKSGQTGSCELAPGVDGWAVEAMAMLHVPVIGGFHFEAGAGLGTKFLVELNAGYAF